MSRRLALLACLLLVAARPCHAGQPAAETLEQVQAAFRAHSGAQLVFHADQLPRGSYHDRMPSLEIPRRLRAARIALREVHKLPAGYLRSAGLETVGLFAACVSEQGDGFRAYDEDLQGYRYFGIWNGRNALAAAYYSDGQLVTTLHHEIFHQVDAARHGKTDTSCFQRDRRLEAALSGKDCYRAPALTARDLAELRKRCRGVVLEKAVSKYADKSVGEDKAETARHLMTALPDALVQVVTRPELPGSQRLLHVLHKYEDAVEGGPGLSWFVTRALEQPATKR
jgi:hypothetical protein